MRAHAWILHCLRRSRQNKLVYIPTSPYSSNIDFCRHSLFFGKEVHFRGKLASDSFNSREKASLKMKSFFVITRIVFSYLCLADIIQANAVSKEDVSDADGLLQTQEYKISEIHKQILLLQNSLAEVTRSFSTLELVAKNPSMMSKIHDPDSLETEHALGDTKKTRNRRDLDSSSTIPTSFPSSVNRNHLGPYSYPMFSGQCFLCPAGVPGPRGPPGAQGIAGRDGRDGRDSPTSPQAQETPAVRPVGNTSLPGTVYIRWGHDECPEGAQLIYAGTVGGAGHTQFGSGANHLCMPDEPIYDEVETRTNADRALLYSSEYQTSAAVPRVIPMNDLTPTCAVCRAPPGRTTKLMIPARNVCPSAEWRLEYAGYLMAARYTHKRSEFICVDREMVPEPGTAGNQNGALLYMTEGRCLAGGGLNCGPYVNGYELTCALCTI